MIHMNFIKENDIDVVVFDDELSPSQQRNLEKGLERKILDRTYLILEIFRLRRKIYHFSIKACSSIFSTIYLGRLLNQSTFQPTKKRFNLY